MTPPSTPQTLSEQTILVTGTSRGIGKALATHFLERGCRVAGIARGEASIEHPSYIHIRADLTVDRDAGRAVRDAASQLGSLHAVVNNAGTASMNHSLLTPSSTVERLMAVNFHSAFTVCREAARFMQARRYGRIVNMGSIVVPLLLEGESVYAASKSALETFSKIFAKEVARFGITCNVVGPGPVATGLIRSVPPEKIEQLLARLALGRLTTFEEVADAVEFFLRPAASALTGQVLYLGGAM